MGSEDFALTRWDDWTNGGDPPPAPLVTFEAWIEWKAGSRNHDPMREATYALGAALRGVSHEGARAAVQGCRNLLAWQRENGHMDQEAATGYTGFHEGAAAAMALAGRAWYQLTGEPNLWLEAVGWWADHLAIVRELRMPDGQVLSVGARVPPDARNHACNNVFGVHLLDPLPHDRLVEWMRKLFTSTGGRGENRTGGMVGLGWDFRRHSWMRMVLAARDSGALPAPVIRRLATGRRPRLITPLYRWSADGHEHAAMPVVKGLGPRQWWCRWRPGRLGGESWSRMDYPSGERSAPHGEPAPWLLPGRGPHASPTPIPIPIGLAPALEPDTQVPPLPTLADLGESAEPPPPEGDPMPEVKVPPPMVAKDPDLRKVQEALQAIRDSHPKQSERRWADRSLKKLNGAGAWGWTEGEERES